MTDFKTNFLKKKHSAYSPLAPKQNNDADDDGPYGLPGDYNHEKTSKVLNSPGHPAPFKKDEGYKPQTQKNKQGGRDMIPQTEMSNMDLDDLEDSREAIFNNEYSDAKDDNDTSRMKLLEGRIAKLDKLIDKKRSKKA
tara:strand:+ start:97 stop:510 length:414 start_codon:yes stop_codon:yes gene_type:complete